ncbi:phage holin [Lactobacillus johnsonii]|uniref:phage holin n=1 Tax=Lactobacillus TaxID=1578 RepID=UPI001AEC322F|nr:phage holin [Lactobacillus taiwanensis]QTQ39432.1 phage holin [Lactobacillus taiwanensis]
MNNILIDVSGVVIALAVSYFVFWYRNHKIEIDSKRAKGDALAFVVDTLGQVATNVVYDLKDSSEKGVEKKKQAKVKIKNFYADAHLPAPSDDQLSGAIEKAVAIMKLSNEGGKNE